MGKPFEFSLAGLPLTGSVVQWRPCESEGPVSTVVPAHVTRLIQPTTIMTPHALPTRACSEWYSGPTDEGRVVPECVRFDIWSASPQELVQLLADDAGEKKAVLIVFDQMPILKGLSPRDVRRDRQRRNRHI